MASETERQTAGGELQNRPAVGLQVTPTADPDAVAGAILRARRHGHTVFVVGTVDPDHETADVINQLQPKVVKTDHTPNGTQPREILTSNARTAGYPGVLWQPDPSMRIDFQRSVDELQTASEYCMEAHRERRGDDATEVNASVDQQSVVAVIPAYNESETIKDIIKKTRPYVDKVVVVNDASTDSTETIAAEHADGVVTHRENMGVGGAVHTGYQVAIREGHDIVVQIDGDGQHDPSYIPDLLTTMDDEDADMVVGSRWLNNSYQEYSPVRRAGIRFFTYEANLLGGLSMTDVTSGFRAYKVEMIEDLQRPENSHWALEQTLEAARKGYTISEVSVPMPPATEGSQFDIGTLIAYPPRMMLITLKILLYR